MLAEGSNGSVVIEAGRIVIRHKKGLLNALNLGIVGDKAIPLANITAVQFKPAGNFMAGYIQFTLLGGTERPGGVKAATTDENAVLFMKPQETAFARLRDEVERLMAEARKPAAVPAPSVAGEIERLAALVERGYLTRAEFDAKKRAILGL